MNALSNNGGYIGYDEEYGLGKVISNGLILSLEVDRKSSYPGNGSTFYDLSGSGYNNTLVNGPIYNNVDNYLSFDGTSQYSKFAVTSTSALTNISVFMWVYPLSDGIFAEMLEEQLKLMLCIIRLALIYFQLEYSELHCGMVQVNLMFLLLRRLLIDGIILGSPIMELQW